MLTLISYCTKMFHWVDKMSWHHSSIIFYHFFSFELFCANLGHFLSNFLMANQFSIVDILKFYFVFSSRGLYDKIFYSRN
jgi:hypothetical protein